MAKRLICHSQQAFRRSHVSNLPICYLIFFFQVNIFWVLEMLMQAKITMCFDTKVSNRGTMQNSSYWSMFERDISWIWYFTWIFITTEKDKFAHIRAACIYSCFAINLGNVFTPLYTCQQKTWTSQLFNSKIQQHLEHLKTLPWWQGFCYNRSLTNSQSQAGWENQIGQKPWKDN